MVKFAVALLVGVPLIAPVLVFRLNPAGNEPLETEYTYGLVPPVGTTLALKAVPTVGVVEIAGRVMTGQIFTVYGRVPVQL
jgi:hypothetical protein